MTAYNKGEIFLANVIFTDGTSTKKRPVVIVSGKSFNSKRDEVIVAAITSNIIRKIIGDIPIKDWTEAGLAFPSVVTGLLFTMKKEMLIKKLGKLSKTDLDNMESTIVSNLDLK